MKNLFTKDSFLKIISFVIAILLWIYVILVVDPSISTTIDDVSVRYSNNALLEERGLVIVEGDEAKISLKVKGSRNAIANIDKKNIYAVADLTDITKAGNHTLPIIVDIPYGEVEIVSQTPADANIMVDTVAIEEREIEIKREGSVAEGYIAGEPVLTTSKVTLTGASTLLAKIKSVKVSLDFGKRNGEINDNERIYFVGTDGAAIKFDDDIYNDVKMSIESVNIVCPVMKHKTVDVEVPVQGDETAAKWSLSTKKVSIYGDDEILKDVESIQTEPLILSEDMAEGPIVLGLIIPEGINVFDDKTEVVVNISKN